MMGKCSDCWWWDKSSWECAYVDTMEEDFSYIGEDGAGIVFDTLDDQGLRIWLRIWLQTGPNFGCVKFKRMFKKEGKYESNSQ